MEQKFVSLDEAVEKLGVSADRLNELRECGQLRAYRDGSSWKFRADEIDKMQQEGVPEPPPPSDIGLDDSLDLGEPLSLDDDDSASEVTERAEESSLELELDTDPVSAGSELELDDLGDTVTSEASDPAIDGDGSSDSILLSEEALGESVGPPGSTIVGKDELEEEADLELALDDDEPPAPHQSDVSLASDVEDVLSSDTDDVLGLEDSGASPASAFENIDELEIDLAAESSRILSPDEVSQAQAAAEGIEESDVDSDLQLDGDLAGDDSDMGSTDVPLLEPEGEELELDAGTSAIELADDDGEDIVLDDSEGSDITLDSGDSGINLAPADSGLALDDIPLDIGGSAILSSIDLGVGGSDPEISLVGDSSDISSQEPEAELQTDDDFQLTPISEGSDEEDGDSSSQVIALDAGLEELEDEGLGGFDDVGFEEDGGGGVMVADDFDEAPAEDLDMGVYAGAAPAASATAEMPYTVLQIIGLGFVTSLLMLGAVMMIDMIRNIWSWDQPYSLNHSIIEAITGLFGS